MLKERWKGQKGRKRWNTGGISIESELVAGRVDVLWGWNQSSVRNWWTAFEDPFERNLGWVQKFGEKMKKNIESCQRNFENVLWGMKLKTNVEFIILNDPFEKNLKKPHRKFRKIWTELSENFGDVLWKLKPKICIEYKFLKGPFKTNLRNSFRGGNQVTQYWIDRQFSTIHLWGIWKIQTGNQEEYEESCQWMLRMFYKG